MHESPDRAAEFIWQVVQRTLNEIEVVAPTRPGLPDAEDGPALARVVSDELLPLPVALCELKVPVRMLPEHAPRGVKQRGELLRLAAVRQVDQQTPVHGMPVGGSDERIKGKHARETV